MRLQVVMVISKCLIAALLAMVSQACLPSTDFDPIAVQVMDNSPVIPYTSCSPLKVKEAEILLPGDVVVEESDPRLWQVDFSPPSPNKEFGLTVSGSEGIVRVMWTPLSDISDILVGRLVLEDGTRISQDFQLTELAIGIIRYEDKNMPLRDFETQSMCQGESPQS